MMAMASQKKYNKNGKGQSTINARKTQHNPFKFEVSKNMESVFSFSIDEFLADSTLVKYEFPSSLTAIERGFIHQFAIKKGLKTKSYGKGSDRHIVISKEKDYTHDFNRATLAISEQSQNDIMNLLGKKPLTKRDLAELEQFDKTNIRPPFVCNFRQSGNISDVTLNVPPQSNSTIDFVKQRQNLPIFPYRTHILEKIRNNQICVISAETGSGKTTQVPQYILEECRQRNECCKIVCTQPRRLAAISVAMRVAQERNEKFPHTVGYQIRLESKVNYLSNLIYTTTGYFLRCLISGNTTTIFKNLTHIILDEVHERDKDSDFLFIAIKQNLAKNPDVKIILMSATIDANIFSNYFNNCPIVDIPGRLYAVQPYYLENVLGLVEFTNPEVEDLLQKLPTANMNSENSRIFFKDLQSPTIDKELVEYVDEILEMCWHSDDPEEFNQFFYLVSGEGVPIDFKHTKTNMTALMIAAGRGLTNAVIQLLSMGANTDVIGACDKTACEWAIATNHRDCAEIIQQFIAKNSVEINAADIESQRNNILLKVYQSRANENEIDHVLLVQLIQYIHQSMPAGGILIFLPGYDDIVTQNDLIMERIECGAINRNIDVFMLHGKMQAIDQRKVFNKLPPSMRKIVLATNIAETSITIDDIVYVIDSGKCKEKTYDPVTSAHSLSTTWISKSCSKQRMGRAGRTQPGICYRLFSSTRFRTFDEYKLPEILRVPLPEICLDATVLNVVSLNGEKSSIADFLGNAISPPPDVNIRESIKLLQQIGALDDMENVTELGIRLIDLPMDVQLSKVVLYSIFLKCIDPILTLASVLSVQDPFTLPSINGESSTTICRKTLSEDTMSDHLILLKIFNMWLEAKKNNCETKFCREYGLSKAIMETICGTRTHILGRLRSNGLVRSDVNKLNTNSSNWAVIKTCLTAGLYPNICRIDKRDCLLKSRHESQLIPHPSSVLRVKNPKQLKQCLLSMPTEWLLYGEKSRAGDCCMVRDNTMIAPIVIALFTGPINMPETNLVHYDSTDNSSDDNNDNDNDNDYTDINDINTNLSRFIIDDWIEFELDHETALLLYYLRQKMNALFVQMLRKPIEYFKIQENVVIPLISKILCAEEKLCGLKSPSTNVGIRPMPIKLRFGLELSHGASEQVPSRSQNYFNDNHSSTSRDITKKTNINASSSSSANLSASWRINSQDCLAITQNARYFVVIADSRENVRKTCTTGQWFLPEVIFLKLKFVKSDTPNKTIFVLFFLPKLWTFMGVVEFMDSQKNNCARCISQKEISVDRFINRKRYSREKNLLNRLATFRDGEELMEKNDGELFIKIMLDIV